MERIVFDTAEITEPFDRESFTSHYTLLQGDPETFDQVELECPRCDWNGQPEETDEKEVETGDYSGWKRLLCPECETGLKSEEETLTKVMNLGGGD